MKYVVAPILLLVAGAIGGRLYARSVKRNSLFYPDRYPTGVWEPASFEVQPTDVWFDSKDGTKLHGWYFDGGNPDPPLVIWFHGNAGNITNRAPAAAGLARRGLSVFLFDYRGYGRSSGSPEEHLLFEDSLAAYDFARAKWQRDPASIVLYGESLGGPYAAFVAKERPSACVVIENSFPSLARLGNALYPLPLGIFVAGSLTTVDWLNEAKRPTLVMHGRRDEVIPFRLGKALYDELDVEKEFFPSENATHSEIPTVEGQRYYDTVGSFVSRHVGQPLEPDERRRRVSR